jgi:outer membrane lipoprotein-sorting protein
MKKSFVFVLTVLLTAAMMPSFSQAQTAQDILEKMIDAQGGRKNLEKITDTTMSGSLEMIQMGFSGSLTMYLKEPDKMRMDMEFMGMVITQAFDGEKAWMINPMTGVAEELPESQAADFKRQAMGNDSLLNPEKHGISYTLKDGETLDGKDYYVIEQTLADGHSSILYIDPETFLVHKAKAKTQNQVGMEVEGETLFSDYRKVEDTMVAFAMTIMQDGSEFLKMNISQVSYNKGLDNDLFKMK